MTRLLNLSLSLEAVTEKVGVVEAAWNTCNPDIVLREFSTDSVWRYCDKCFIGTNEIKRFLEHKWSTQIHYRLSKELWAYSNNRIAIRFEYEWQHARSGQWFRTHGNEQWELDRSGLLSHCDTSATDIAIEPIARRIGFASNQYTGNSF